MSPLNYQQALLELNILPIPYFMQVKDLLTLSKFINGFYNCKYNLFIICKDHDDSALPTRSASLLLFRVRRPTTKIAAQNFWYQSTRLANLLYPNMDVTSYPGLKQPLLKYAWSFFKTFYNDNIICSWRLHCDCIRNCRNVIRQV